MLLKARFEPVPASRLKEGPQMKGNAYRPVEHEPTPALLRLAEQFGETLGPFITAEDIRPMLAYRFKKTSEDRAKAEQMLRDASVPPSPGAKPEDLPKALEALR